MEVGIDKIFEYLSWDSNNEIQKRGIELASNINNLSVLIMPIENKSIWENCAKVLISKSDEELELYFFELFEWLKDMNWPGAYLIYDRLICVSTEKFLPAYQYSLSAAKQTEDRIWERALKDLFVEYVFRLIDWHMPDEIQSKGISLARNIDTIVPFIQPLTPKHNINVWENCAVIIAERSDKNLEPYLDSLLKWLEDPNRPGAFKILDRLKIFSGEKLKNPFMNRFTYAVNLDNEDGLKIIDYLSELLDNQELKATLPISIIEKLQKHYKNWGFWYND